MLLDVGVGIATFQARRTRAGSGAIPRTPLVRVKTQGLDGAVTTEASAVSREQDESSRHA